MVSRGGGEGIGRWESLLALLETKKKEAEATKTFWESAGRLAETLRLLFKFCLPSYFSRLNTVRLWLCGPRKLYLELPLALASLSLF